MAASWSASGQARDWVRYWRAPGGAMEVMRAHFETHRYHRHSHDTYSFGVTESGAQTFLCRGAKRTSAAGMVMAFNPDEPHDGHATHALGFTYSIVHIPKTTVTEILGDQRGRRVGLPLFAEPVLHDRAAAEALRRLSATVASGQQLALDEARDAAVRALARCTPLRADMAIGGAEGAVDVPRCEPGVLRVCDLLRAEYTREITSSELSALAGCSRFALYRAFSAHYGMSPGDYQRQLRLRAARDLLARGSSPAQAAADAGFADQAHLTRWFGRCYGITPARYRTAVFGGAQTPEPARRTRALPA